MKKILSIIFLALLQFGSASAGIIDYVSPPQVASASTVVLTGQAAAMVEITGTTTITAFTLEVGKIITLRFTAETTVTPGGSLLTPGGAPIITTAGTTCSITGGASSVVAITECKNADGYKKETVDHIYMNSNGDIGHSSAFSGDFTVGKFPTGAGSTYFEFTLGGYPFFKKDGLGNNVVQISIDNLSGGTARTAAFPDFVGTKTFVMSSNPPTTSSDSCRPGQVAWDSSYFYECVTYDTWMRVGLSTW